MSSPQGHLEEKSSLFLPITVHGSGQPSQKLKSLATVSPQTVSDTHLLTFFWIDPFTAHLKQRWTDHQYVFGHVALAMSEEYLKLQS